MDRCVGLNYARQQNLLSGFLAYICISVGGILVAGLMVLYWAPEAAGGGVNSVIAFLNGNHVPNAFRPRTLTTKVVSTFSHGAWFLKI